VGFDVDESLGGKLADDGLEAVPSLGLLVMADGIDLPVSES
jgi:hypothetical protein